MHTNILSRKQQELLPLIKQFSDDFGLVGGTAIALHLGHRRSIDFDLFRSKSFNIENIRSKILKKCTLPLTGQNCVHRVVTDMAVLDLTKEGFVLKELAPGLSIDEVKSATHATLRVDPELKEMQV